MRRRRGGGGGGQAVVAIENNVTHYTKWILHKNVLPLTVKCTHTHTHKLVMEQTVSDT